MTRPYLLLLATIGLALGLGAVVVLAQEEGTEPRPPKPSGEFEGEELSEQEMEEIVSWLKEFEPEKLERLQQWKKEKPEAVSRFLRQCLGEIRELKELRETDPEKFERMMAERKAGMKRLKGEGERGKFPPEGGEGERGKSPREKGEFQRMKKELTDAEAEEALAWLKEFDPGRLGKLESVKTENPKEYSRFLCQCYMEMAKTKEFAQRDPEGYQRMVKQRKLDSECSDLAEKYRKETNEETKKTLREQLAQKVGEQFDIRQAEREQGIKKLEEELTRLKDSLQKRKSGKQAIVDNRLQEILGEKRELEW